MKVLIVLVSLLMLATSGALAKSCAQDGVCDEACMNNTIDGFDPDCGIPETELYTFGSTGLTRAAQDGNGQQSGTVDLGAVDGAPRRVCSPIKDGVCETTCEGIDLDCLCGDFECQAHETYATCPKDCVHEINRLCPIIRDGHCDPECRPFDADCAKDRMAAGLEHAEEEWGVLMHMVQTTLVIILLILCGWLLYLLHKAHEARMGR